MVLPLSLYEKRRQYAVINKPTKPPFPDDMALILCRKFIKKLFCITNYQTKDDPVIGIEEKIKNIKKMQDKNILTEEQYSKAVELSLSEYIKSHPEKSSKNALNEFEKYIM